MLRRLMKASCESINKLDIIRLEGECTCRDNIPCVLDTTTKIYLYNFKIIQPADYCSLMWFFDVNNNKRVILETGKGINSQKYFCYAFTPSGGLITTAAVVTTYTPIDYYTDVPKQQFPFVDYFNLIYGTKANCAIEIGEIVVTSATETRHFVPIEENGGYYYYDVEKKEKHRINGNVVAISPSIVKSGGGGVKP